MTRSSLIRVCVLVVSIALGSACRTQQDGVIDPVEIPVAARDISIGEAQSWLNRESAGARIDGTLRAKRNEYWSAAKKQTYRNGLAVISVPLTYNYNRAVALKRGQTIPKTTPGEQGAFIDQKLLIYKDKTGKITADVLRMFPSDEYRKTHKTINGADFEGMVLAYDVSETEFMGGFYYKNGQATGRVGLKKSKNARVLGDCDILIYTPADGNAPAKFGSGDTGTSDGSFVLDGIQWVLNQTISMDCGSGPSPGPGGEGATGGDMGSADWTWASSSGGGSTGGTGYASYTTGSPYDPTQLTPDGVSNLDPVDAFLYDMT